MNEWMEKAFFVVVVVVETGLSTKKITTATLFGLVGWLSNQSINQLFCFEKRTKKNIIINISRSLQKLERRIVTNFDNNKTN